MNPHKTFLTFFLAVSTGELLKQTYDLLGAIVKFGVTTADVPNYFRIWFFGFHIQTPFLSVDFAPAWPALLIILVCYLGWRMNP